MMDFALFAPLFFLASHFLQSSAVFPHSSESITLQGLGAVQAVISSQPQHECTVLLMLNNPSQIILTFLKVVEAKAPRGVTVFQVEIDKQNDNVWVPHLQETVDKVRQMGQLSHCLMLVVVSDDQTFLAGFAHQSLRRHALKWSTRILVLTRLPLSQLGGLHGLLSNRNAILLRVQEGKKAVRNVGVYVVSPFSTPTTKPRRVVNWSPNTTWTRGSYMQLFPEKFSVFSPAPTLKIGIELLPQHTISWVEDPDAPNGRRLTFTGALAKVAKYFSRGMNFTYEYVVSPERTYGNKLPNGSWTGLIAMMVKGEVDFSLGPFSLSPVRISACDFSVAMWTGSTKMAGGLRGLQIDPWGFMLPLRPLVWAATLTALLGVLMVLQLLASCLPDVMLNRSGFQANTFSCLRIILQQDIELPAEWWWWERLVLGLWMLMTLVLTKSYAGNLMSLLAVRYVPQPFQTLRDVLDDPHVGMIWEKHSRNEQFLRDVESGIYKEVADLEEKGRLEFHTQTQFLESLSTLVRGGQHVLITGDITLSTLIASDFSQKGRCDFYQSRNEFFPFSASMMSQKTNPILHALNPRLMDSLETGLIRHWAQDVPNFTRCNNVPKKVMLSTTLSTTNLWGVFALLAGGMAGCLLVWCAELLITSAKNKTSL